jgi:hypothetical protein
LFKNHARLLLPLALAAAFSVSAAPGVSGALFAQEAKPAVQEPEYVYQVFLLGADGKLVALEQQKPTYKTQAHRVPFKGITVTGEYTVPYPESTVRIAPDAHFIVRVPDGFDPRSVIYLKPFVVETAVRALPVATAKGLYTVRSTETPDTSLAVTFKKYGKNSVEIIPAKPLDPGEYAFGITGNIALGLACFAIDPK